MRRPIGWLMVCVWLLFANAGYAQSVSLTADPAALKLSGRIDSETLSASLRLIARVDLAGVQIQLSDLVDATGDGRVRDPIPSGAATVLPQAGFESVSPAHPTQVVVQVSPPQTAGVFTGTLTVYWARPSPGELSIPLTVETRTRPALAVYSPAQLALRGVKGQTVSGSLTLRETVGGSPLTGLRAVSQDLRTLDGQNAIPADNMAVALPEGRIPGGELLAATVQIDLRGVPAGDYSGQVLLSADEGNLVSLPVSVQVRHAAWPAVLILLLGAALGLCIKAYQTEGKTRDALIARLAAVRHELDADADLRDLFGTGLNPLVVRGESLVRRKQWELAGQTTQDAETMLLKWHGAREGWIDQLGYLERELMPGLEGESVTQKALHHQAQTIKTSVGALDSPADLRARLFAIEVKIAQFGTLKKRIDALGTVRVEAANLGAAAPAADLREQWRKQQQALYDRLAQLSPDDTAGWTKLEADIQTMGEEMAQEIEKSREAQAATVLVAKEPVEAVTRGEARGTTPVGALLSRLNDSLKAVIALAAPPAEAGSFTPAMGQTARYRQRIFAWVTYLLGGLLLAGAGFAALYLAKPTFGADLVGDYLSLLAWGLGGQTSLTALVDVVRGWGVVLGKETAE